MAAWGHAPDYYAGLSGVDEGITSVFAYPIAAFARIVAEDPSLQPAYGGLAVDYANAMIQTYWALFPQIKFRSVGNLFEAYLAHPDSYRTKLTNCNGNQTCNNLHDFAGAPMAHNESNAYMMALIELWRALDSPFYRQAPTRTSDADATRTLIPLLVSRQQRYFVDSLQTRVDPTVGERYFWHHEDDIPHSINTEDTAHGSLDMRYEDVLRVNLQRLNAATAPWGEPIPLETAQLGRFANTFLQDVAGCSSSNQWCALAYADNLRTDLDGRSSGTLVLPGDKSDSECDGWVQLADANPRVYRICREVSLRIVNGGQTVPHHRQPLGFARGQGLFLTQHRGHLWLPLVLGPSTSRCGSATGIRGGLRLGVPGSCRTGFLRSCVAESPDRRAWRARECRTC